MRPQVCDSCERTPLDGVTYQTSSSTMCEPCLRQAIADGSVSADEVQPPFTLAVCAQCESARPTEGSPLCRRCLDLTLNELKPTNPHRPPTPCEFIQSEKHRIENEIIKLEPRLKALAATATEAGLVWKARIAERDDVSLEIEALRIQLNALDTYQARISQVQVMA